MDNANQQEFILEAREHLFSFEAAILGLETVMSAEQSRDLVHAGFRCIHSLKGDAGFLGYRRVSQLAHAMESLLDPFRVSDSALPGSVIEALLSAKDLAMAMVDDLSHSEDVDISKHLQRLSDLTQHVPASVSAPIAWAIESTRDSQPLGPIFQHLNSFGSVSFVAITTPIDLSEPLGTATVRIEGQLIPDRDVSDALNQLNGFASILVATSERSSEIVHTSQVPAAHCVTTQPVPVNGQPIAQIVRAAAAQPDFLAAELVYATDDLTRQLPGPVTHLRIMQAAARSDPTTPQPTTPQPTTPQPTTPLPTVLPTPEAVPDEGSTPRIAVSPTTSKPARATVSTKASRVSTDSDRPTSLRINIELLDRMMNLVGELTLVRNQSQLVLGGGDGPSATVLQRLSSVTSELQDTVLQTRMQPVANLFDKFPRMVRDLARQLGKQIELETVGTEVELDKTVLEQLSDPLMHLIRNSVDHGLETSVERESAGKPATGKVVLSATPADGHVLIEIRDDGRGIDPQSVRAKAIAMGLRTESELTSMSSRELYSLILLPGFSTAKAVTDVSGRGVGMDVVRTNVERLEGTLTIDSTPGLGTTMQVRVPLTLAIIPCLMVSSGNQEYAMPQRGLEEIVCLYPGGPGKIGRAFDAETYCLRDRLLPIVRFSEVLKRPSPFTPRVKAEIMETHGSGKAVPGRIEYILVLRVDGRRFGLLVDEVKGTQEVVVKPMHPALKRIGIFSGATQKGDGTIAMIANPEGIAAHARTRFEEARAPETTADRHPKDVHRVLIFECGPNEQFALPIVQVARVQQVDPSQLERIGAAEFLNVDGRVTRLLRLDQYLDVSPMQPGSESFVILPKFIPEAMGILISRIVDNQSLSMAIQQDALTADGIVGTAIIGERLSLFLDLNYLRTRAFGHASTAEASPHTSSGDSSLSKSQELRHKTVLLVDDTPFFREIVKRYLSEYGIHVSTAADGQEGLRELASGKFDLVVSDIEMPIMDGWAFCKAARMQGHTVPFLALTSLEKSAHAERAAQCGFDDFEEKLDHDRLLLKVKQLLLQSAVRIDGATR